MCFCARENHLIKTFLLSTNSIYFGWEIKKIKFQYALLSGGLIYERSFLSAYFCLSVNIPWKAFKPANESLKLIMYMSNRGSNEPAQMHRITFAFIACTYTVHLGLEAPRGVSAPLIPDNNALIPPKSPKKSSAP